MGKVDKKICLTKIEYQFMIDQAYIVLRSFPDDYYNDKRKIFFTALCKIEKAWEKKNITIIAELFSQEISCFTNCLSNRIDELDDFKDRILLMSSVKKIYLIWEEMQKKDKNIYDCDFTWSINEEPIIQCCKTCMYLHNDEFCTFENQRIYVYDIETWPDNVTCKTWTNKDV